MEKNISQTPFLRILEPENLSKIEIDEKLVPAFRVVILKINDYFMENGLMDAKDWDSFFDDYLLKEVDKPFKISIRKEMFSSNSCAVGEYIKEDRSINIKYFDNKNFESILCHEFIHFLVMADSNSLNYKLSDCSFINEGMTELLSSKIMGKVTAYPLEVSVANFYTEMSEDAFICFLNDIFYFNNQTHIAKNLALFSNHYYLERRDSDLIQIQRQIVDASLEKCDHIDSFTDLVMLINKLSKRRYNDADYMKSIYNKVIDLYLYYLDVSEKQKNDLRKRINLLCELSYKVQLYGDKDVTECLIGDIQVAFDKDGNLYKNHQRLPGMQWSFSPHDKMVDVIYKGITYKISVDDKDCINWENVYESYLNEIQSLIKMQDNQNAEEEKQEYEVERQRIMKARFSDEDKQRMLQELEEEYRNNSFGNNSGRSIR